MLNGMHAIGLKCLERRKARAWTQLKALTLYLTALDLVLTVQSLNVPQLDELNGLFNDD